MFLTCFAIFAVDFNVFPRRFAKTEHFGTSVMDLGVGSCIFAMGLTSHASRPLVSSNSGTSKSPSKRSIFNTTAAWVILFGIVRLVVTKYVQYQEHVTEYGVHWNFFFTIAMVMVGNNCVHRLRVSFPTLDHWKSFVCAGFAILAFYQVCPEHLNF